MSEHGLETPIVDNKTERKVFVWKQQGKGAFIA
jgi:hypothetical protein